MDTPRGQSVDTGSAYDMEPSSYNASLTEVGRGTPCGEFMRRYWQPVAVSRDVTDIPQNVRILGEDLILFRDKTRPPGPRLSALRASRHHALLRQGRGAGHPLLLSRLAVRRGRPLPRAALRA